MLNVAITVPTPVSVTGIASDATVPVTVDARAGTGIENEVLEAASVAVVLTVEYKLYTPPIRPVIKPYESVSVAA